MLNGHYKFILLTSLIFTLFLQANPPFVHRVSHHNFSKRMACNLESFIDHKQHYLHTALVIGPCKRAPKNIAEILNDFGLVHLITPSGLHIAGLVLLLNRTPLSPSIKAIFWLLSWPLMIFLNYLAIARICLYHFWTYFFKKIAIPISAFSKFNLTFFVDFLIGSYNASAQSFHFSYHFLGTLISASGKVRMFFYLLFSQAVMSILYQYHFKLLQAACGILISAIFPVFYILLVATTPFQSTHPAIEACLQMFIEFLQLLNSSLPSININLDLTVFIVIIFLRSRKFFILFFIFYSTETGFNGNAKILERSTYYQLTSQPLEVFVWKETVIETHRNGHCKINLHDNFWNKECYKRKFKKL